MRNILKCLNVIRLCSVIYVFLYVHTFLENEMGGKTCNVRLNVNVIPFLNNKISKLMRVQRLIVFCNHLQVK